MKVEKEVTVTVEVEVDQSDLVNSIWNKEDAKNLIIGIDNTIEDWGFTVDVLTDLLDTLNYYQDEVNQLEMITPEFVAQLRLAMENFVGESK